MPSMPPLRRTLRRVATLGAVLGVLMPSLLTPTTASAANFIQPGLTPLQNSPYFQNSLTDSLTFPNGLTASTNSPTLIQIYELNGNAVQPTTGFRVASCNNATSCSYAPPGQSAPTF